MLGLGMDGLPALDLWDVVIEVLRPLKSTKSPTRRATRNCSWNQKAEPKLKGNRDVDQLSHVDHVTTNANSFQGESQLCFWRGCSSDPNEKQKEKSNDETRAKNPQSCAYWFSDRIDLDAQNPNQMCRHQKPNARTCWPKAVVHVTNGTIFFHCWTSWISRCLPAAILSQTEGRVSCPRELRKARLKKVRQWRNRDRWIWCQGTLLSAKKNPSARSGCFEQPGNQELDQSYVSSSARKLVRNSI